MSKQKSYNPGIDDLTEDDLAVARKAAKAKLARQVVEQEMGLSDSDIPVRKGPMPMPSEEMVQVTIDLAPYADRIRLDYDAPYMQGKTYTVGLRKAQVLNEQMARTWGHQAEIEGKDPEFYLKNRFKNTAIHANTSARVSL